jgi:DNA repair photolyase
MPVKVTTTSVRSILTRSSGYLRTVCSHSLQPYRGCSFGASLCGVGCYVRHNPFVTRGAEWGRFLEVRDNAASAYLAQYDRERRWARSNRNGFEIFMSSATDPFVPHERRFGVTRSVLEAMLEEPPDGLIIQTHTHLVTCYLEIYRDLAKRCRLRIHISIESDRDRLPGLPPPASSVARRLEAAARLRASGLRVAITVAPLLPIADADAFFTSIAECADAAVIDHFIGGDGSADGARTLRTALPRAMAAVEPGCLDLAYRDAMVAVATRHMPGRVGVGIDGFAGRLLPVGRGGSGVPRRGTGRLSG